MHPFTQFCSGDRRLRAATLSAFGMALATQLCCSLPAFALNINLIEAPANTTLEPTYDPNLTHLGNIMQAAADYWESIILDNHQVTVTYGYVDLAPATHGIAQVTGDDGQRATTGNIAFDIETNSVGDWFFDPTPTNHSEFNMHQVLYRDLAPVTQGLYYDGSPHDVLEVGYWGNYVGADQGRDALTTAVHELGHILGLSQSLPDFGGETGDGDYDFNIFYTQGKSLRRELRRPRSCRSRSCSRFGRHDGCRRRFRRPESARRYRRVCRGLCIGVVWSTCLVRTFGEMARPIGTIR